MTPSALNWKPKMQGSSVKVEWTEGAKDDLKRIRQYLTKKVSPAYAKRITQEILAEVSSLKVSPDKGKFVDELEELRMTNYRQLLAHQNRIIFERTATSYYIHIVCHTTMNFESLLRQRVLR